MPYAGIHSDVPVRERLLVRGRPHLKRSCFQILRGTLTVSFGPVLFLLASRGTPSPLGNNIIFPVHGIHDGTRGCFGTRYTRYHHCRAVPAVGGAHVLRRAVFAGIRGLRAGASLALCDHAPSAQQKSFTPPTYARSPPVQPSSPTPGQQTRWRRSSLLAVAHADSCVHQRVAAALHCARGSYTLPAPGILRVEPILWLALSPARRSPSRVPYRTSPW